MKRFAALLLGLLLWAHQAQAADTLAFWTARANEPPASSAATPSTRNAIPILTFVEGSDTCAEFAGMMPLFYSGDVNVKIGWTSLTAATNAVSWNVAFKSVTDDADDLDTKSYAAANNASCTTPDNAGEVDYCTVAFTAGADMDSVSAGEYFRLQVCRDGDGSSGTDSSTDTAQFFFAVMETQ